MERRKELTRLSALAHLDADAVAAYDAALRQCGADLAEHLREFRGDHLRHVEELSELLVRFGGNPIAPEPDLKGSLYKGVTAASGVVGSAGALFALIGGEELTSRSYDWVLKGALTPDVRAILERCFADEKRHLAICKDALRQRFYSREAEANP